ncbi:hypothetical protein GQ44DRAFT_702557 [Phaeosphaeriaceae sp. PMI808]|nr:hypothetical protein GQ44DRAFT_702557 [Phaeosphaeriaceae sp. PMI808]
MQQPNYFINHCIAPYRLKLHNMPPKHKMRRHFKDFCSTENVLRTQRGESAFCTTRSRDAAFERLLKLARGEEKFCWAVHGPQLTMFDTEQFIALDGETWPNDKDEEDEGIAMKMGKGKGKVERKDSKEVSEEDKVHGDWRIELVMSVDDDVSAEYTENIDDK